MRAGRVTGKPDLFVHSPSATGRRWRRRGNPPPARGRDTNLRRSYPTELIAASRRRTRSMIESKSGGSPRNIPASIMLA